MTVTKILGLGTALIAPAAAYAAAGAPSLCTLCQMLGLGCG
jgi:hypothetical protein